MQKRINRGRVLASAIFLAASMTLDFSVNAAEAPGTYVKSGAQSTNSEKDKKLQEPERGKPGTAAPDRRRVQLGRKEVAGAKHASTHQKRRSTTDDVASLKEQLALQQKQIEQLRSTLEEQKQLLERTLCIERAQAGQADQTRQASQAASAHAPNLGQVASLTPVLPSTTSAAAIAGVPSALTAEPSSAVPPVTRSEVQEYTTKVEELGKKMDGALKNLGGFKFSGDFRYRADAQLRSGNSIAAPLQNVRSRYRLRVNLDKELDPRFKFHVQLSTGPINNALTNDQDFAATTVKQPFSLAEAFVDFHPNKNFSIRGGRMEEVFADGMRFLWDDDVRFNGFQQIATIPVAANPLGIKSFELRGGEYFLSNPNVVILSATSPLVSAGFKPGTKVRDANLFHPGLVVKGDLGTGWSHQFTGDIQIYRNQNQIQLASLASGFPILVSNGVGLALSGPITGTGNATTTSGGAIYNAPNFQIARLVYRLEHKGWKLGKREMPAYLDFQASRNVGTSKLRDGVLASANLGAVKGFGDVRFLYQFAIKDANSLISQFTDDDLGTGTGVNIQVHAVRFDLGLTRFLQWQNLLFMQDERRPSNPAAQFFVPLQRGANTTYRYLGQLAFSF